MGWIIGIFIVIAVIGAFTKGGGNSGGGGGGGGGGGRKMGLGTKMTVAGVGGYALGKKIAKL